MATLISARDVVVSEADGYADVLVSLNAPSTQLVTVNYTTSSITAFGGYDYGSVNGTLNFAPGVTSQVVRVPITEDTLIEGMESLSFALSSPSANASIPTTKAIITIYDGNSKPNPVPPSFTITPSVSSANEGSSINYVVSTTGVANGSILEYQLTGVSSSDVVGGNLTGSFVVGANGQGSITISIAADQQTEGNETLLLILLNNGIAVGTAAPVAIVDSSKATLPPVLPTLGPIDDFVVLQPSNSTITGAGVGNDVYLLSGSMLPAGKQITLSDTNGSNTLQLAPGLSVASSQVTATALKLNFTNGSGVTVLGADKFGFDLGGNLSAGINPTDFSYSQFVQSVLGTTIPTAGVNSGGALSVVGGGPAASVRASTASGDDFLVLQAASSAVVGAGAGNDTYLIASGMLTANNPITISDAAGANSLQLVRGLQIASAQIAATALKLNLVGGASVTVLGADKFTYEVGGNTTAGIDQPDLSYSQFVQSALGGTVPLTGVVTAPASVI